MGKTQEKHQLINMDGLRHLVSCLREEHNITIIVKKETKIERWELTPHQINVINFIK